MMGGKSGRKGFVGAHHDAPVNYPTTAYGGPPPLTRGGEGLCEIVGADAHIRPFSGRCRHRPLQQKVKMELKHIAQRPGRLSSFLKEDMGMSSGLINRLISRFINLRWHPKFKIKPSLILITNQIKGGRERWRLWVALLFCPSARRR